MAFNPSTSTRNPAAGSPAAPARRTARSGAEYEAALGFVNFYVPTAGGQRRKLGTIPLNASNATQKNVFERLKTAQTDEERLALVAGLVGILQVEFNEQIDENAAENQIAWGV